MSCSQTEIQGMIWHGLLGTEIPCPGCVSHSGYLAHGNSKGEVRGRNRHKSNTRRVVRILEERNVGTK